MCLRTLTVARRCEAKVDEWLFGSLPRGTIRILTASAIVSSCARSSAPYRRRVQLAGDEPWRRRPSEVQSNHGPELRRRGSARRVARENACDPEQPRAAITE